MFVKSRSSLSNRNGDVNEHVLTSPTYSSVRGFRYSRMDSKMLMGRFSMGDLVYVGAEGFMVVRNEEKSGKRKGGEWEQRDHVRSYLIDCEMPK